MTILIHLHNNHLLHSHCSDFKFANAYSELPAIVLLPCQKQRNKHILSVCLILIGRPIRLEVDGVH